MKGAKRSRGLTDEQLIHAARNNDKAAFKQLVERYEGQVAATVVGMLGNTHEAEDVGQETFIRFYRALDNFRGDSGVGTYLTRIAMNLSLNAITRRRSILGRFLGKTEEEISQVPDPQPDRPDQWEQKERVQKALQQLDPDFRSVVVLRLMDGYSTEETARLLKIPMGTVMSRLARAQKNLKDILKSELEERHEQQALGTPAQVV